MLAGSVAALDAAAGAHQSLGSAGRRHTAGRWLGVVGIDAGARLRCCGLNNVQQGSACTAGDERKLD